MPDEPDIDGLRDHFDNTDLSPEIDAAQWTDGEPVVLACAYPADLLVVPIPDADPIVITTEATAVPAEHVDAVHAAAAACGVHLRTP